ncbi:MAG TPA: hypothetical protein VF530_08380 [Planctomycetota bacterium]
MSGERRVPRVLGCLIKGPAGCLAFFIGAGVVLVLLLPAAGGRVIDHLAESAFAQRFAGELELGDAWLGSFYGEQVVERLVLRDPTGEEVLRGRLTGPYLTWGLDGVGYRYGPLRLVVEHLRIDVDEDGVTNLERAFARDPRSRDEPRRRSQLQTDTPFEIELELYVARLRYASARGREGQLEDLRFRGRLEWGPERTHLVLEGGEGVSSVPGPRLALRVECERPEDGLERPWDLALALEHGPAVLARALCPALRPLVAQLGPEVDGLQWTREGSAVALSVHDAGARLAFHGREVDGLVGGMAESPLELALPCGEPLGRGLAARLLPPLESLVCEDATQPHVVRLHDFQWPLDGDWSALEGEAELALAPARAFLAPLGPEPRTLVALLGPQPVRLPVRGGVLDFAGLQLPLEDGWLRLDGALDLAGGRRSLGVAGESAGAELERVELVEETPLVPEAVPALAPPAPRLPLPPEGVAPDGMPVPEAPEPQR